jgi:diguanylate cyclase (GGDEF)-like protein
MISAQQPNGDALPIPTGSLLAVMGWTASDNGFASESLDIRVQGMNLVWLILFFAMMPVAVFLWPAIAANTVSIVPVAGACLAPLLIAALVKWSKYKALAPHVRSWAHTGAAAFMGLMFSQFVSQSANLEQAHAAFLVLGGTMMVLVAAFSRLPGAMLAFPVGLMLMGPPLGRGPMIWALSAAMLVSMIAIVLRLARNEFRTNAERWGASQKAVRSDRLIAEFEEHSPSWFWETDRTGAISYISPKIAAVLNPADGDMIGVPIKRIVRKDDDTPVGERDLGFHISTRTTFSELPVPAAIPSEDRWWAMSGRPLLDQFGQFRGFIGTGTDLTEKRRSAAEVEKLARYDSLTGLANRAETAKVLHRALGAGQTTVKPTGLMMLDLDRFKAVNDTLGHPVGDELLRQVSARLSQAVGTLGQVGRLGGDEFKVVLPGLCDKSQLAALATAMIEAASKPYYISSSPVLIGASIGIAIAPDDGLTSDDLIRNADLALYAAKGAGRGTHRFYEKSMHSVAEQRRMIENDMRKALAGGEFRMVYQPIVELQSEKIIGFESLIRWNHPVRGPISPADFISIAEENGMIEAIGEWALRTSAAEAAAWAVPARVAVNVSTIQFANPKFPALVANVLAQSGLERERLELEITESVFVADTEATDQQFEMLKKLGVRLALDDFGTGYSSLGYLKRAPFDKIKIDQSFVRGASLGHDKNAAIIKAIVTLAETMNLETTAEGVETQDEIEFIRGLGCSHIQGFVYGKPIEAEVLRERLGTRGDIAERLGHKSTREPRVRVFRVSQLTVNGRSQAVRIRNISNEGAMIEGPSWLTEGTAVEIDIADNLTVHAIVRWVDDDKLGLQFDQRVDLASILQQPTSKAG